LAAPTGISNYDLRFDAYFRCRHPWQPPGSVVAVPRIGAIPNYDLVYDSLRKEGTTLLHNPEQHLRCSELPRWYPLIEDLTPKSVWTTGPPAVAQIEATLGWPVFMKGVRQTSRHRRSLSIIEGPEQFARALMAYAGDSILRWQGIVCREFIPLRRVEDTTEDRVPSSFEFRTFWWKGEMAGCGRYWWDGKPYRMSEREEAEGLAVAQDAAKRVNVPFLVVDIAQTAEGRWLVIECNDGQESGYAGIAPVALWQRIIDLERRKSEAP
jgi:hypothetical protein